MIMLKRTWLAALLCAAGLVTVNAAPPSLDDAAAPITLGQWHASLDKAKAYSEQHNIPLLYIWGYDGCSKCALLDKYIARPAFTAWQAERKLVMAYFKQKNTNASPEKNFAKYGLNGTINLFPFVAVYWPSKNNKPYNFVGRYSSPNEELKFIAAIEAYIGEYVDVPPAQDEWDPADDGFAGANVLDPSAGCQVHGPHLLNVNDTSDWFEVINTEAGKEYALWITAYSESGTTDLRADFYADPTNAPTLSMPLANLLNGHRFEGGNPLFVNVARAAETNALAGYTMNVCEWVPCTLTLTAAAATGNAGNALNVEVRRIGEARATSATLTMINGTAAAGQDFNGTPVVVNFPAGGSDTRSAAIPLIKDTTWEPDKTFTVVLTPDPGSAIAGAITQQLVTIRSNIPAKSGVLAFTGYGPGNARISARGIGVVEGETVRLWIQRSGGSDTEVAAHLAWSSGGAGFEVDPLLWGHGEEGLRFVDVTVPRVPGYQGSVSVLLTLTSPDTAVNGRAATVRFNVSDSDFGDSVSNYVRGTPGVLPYRARGDDWFHPSDAGGECLRSKTPAQVGASVSLTVALTGPGVLMLNAGIADASGEGLGAGLYTLTAGLRATPVPIAAENPDLLAFVIPSGRQTVTFKFERTAETAEGDFAWFCNPNYVKLDAIAQLSPLPNAVVIEGAQQLAWDHALAPLAGIDGLDAAYVVYAGTDRNALDEVAEIAVEDAGVVPVAAAIPAVVTAAVTVDADKTYYWRVDVLLDDGSAPMQVAGAVSSFSVVPAAAPQFAVNPPDFEEQLWYRDLSADGSTVTLEMLLGMQARIGPFAVNVAGGAAAAVRVVGGALPRGISAEVTDGALYLSGTPSSAGSGYAVIRVSAVTGGGTVAGTTLGVIFTVLPLPEQVYGAFEGVVLLHNPAGDRPTPATAAVTIRNNGAASGRITPADGGSFSFRTTGFSGDEYYAGGLFVQRVEVTDRSGVTLFVEMVIDLDANAENRGATPMGVTTLLDDNGAIGELQESTLYRNIWRDRNLDPEVAAALAAIEGYYTVSLPGSVSEPTPLVIGGEDEDVYGNGYLTLTVSSRGAVRVSGKLADGERFSASASLVITGERAFVTVMSAPRSYSGGHFLADLDFLPEAPVGVASLTPAAPATRNLPLVSARYWWVSRNPQATGEYGAGFNRMVKGGIAGGYYSKNESLYDYFLSAELGFEACYEEWECETVRMAANARGNGFVIPAGGTEGNPVHLSVSARLATGLLTIAFRRYPEEGTRYTSLTGEGVLTPYFQLVPDLQETSARAYILEPSVHPERGYRYNASTPFALTGECGECVDQ